MKISKLNLKYLINIDNYISKKDITLLFLLLVLAIIPPAISGNPNSNMGEKFIYIVNNPLSNILFFIGIIIIIINIKKNICYNELLYARYDNYKQMISCGIKSIIISVINFYTAFIVVAIAGSILFCLGNYQFDIYDKYNISMMFYILFKYIKNFLIYEFVSIIIFILSFFIKKQSVKFIFLLLLFLFYFLNFTNFKINHFYQIPILFQTHLLSTNYISFYIEFIISTIYLIFLYVIEKLIFILAIKKKVFLN